MVLTAYLLFKDGIGVDEELNNSPTTETPFPGLDLDSEAGRGSFMAQLQRCSQSQDAGVRAKAYEVLSYVTTSKYQNITEYAQTIVEQTIAVFQTDEDKVVNAALEIWASVAEMEAQIMEMSGPTHALIATHASKLVPAILSLLGRSSDDAHNVESWDAKMQAVSRNALMTLWTIVGVLPGTFVMQLLAPFIAQHIATSKAWYSRKAAIMALTILSQFDEAETLVKSSLGLILACGHAPELALRDAGALCLFRVAEHMPDLFGDLVPDIVAWLSRLEMTNPSEYLILSCLVDSLHMYLSFDDEDLPAMESFASSESQLLTLFVKWTSSEKVLDPIPCCASLLETLSSLLEHVKGAHKHLVEQICLNLITLLDKHLRDSKNKLAADVISVFGAAVAREDLVSLDTCQRCLSSAMQRVSASDSAVDTQEFILLVTDAAPRFDPVFPLLGQTCAYCLKVLNLFGVYEEDGAELDDPNGDGDEYDPIDEDADETTETSHTQQRKIKRTTSNLALEDCLRLLELLFDTYPVQMASHAAEIRESVLRLTLVIPPRYILIQTSVAAALSSLIRNDPLSVSICLSPLLALLYQIYKNVNRNTGEDNNTVFNSILVTLQSAILSVNSNGPAALVQMIRDSFEFMLTVIKDAAKQESVDPDVLGSSLSLIGDYLSRQPIDEAQKQRLRSASDMIIAKWDDPDEAIVEYAQRKLTEV